MNEYSPNLTLAREQVKDCIDYYEIQANPERDNPSMWLGLFMAKHLNKLLNESEPNIKEVRLPFRALDKNGDVHGSQWHWMSSIAKWWLESLEEKHGNKP